MGILSMSSVLAARRKLSMRCRIIPGGFDRICDGGAQVNRLTGDLVVDMATAALIIYDKTKHASTPSTSFPFPTVTPPAT